MNVKNMISALVVSGLLAPLTAGVANAHPAVSAFPVHHATSLALVSVHKVAPSFFTLHATNSSALVHSQLISALHLSGASRAQLNFDSSLVGSGFKSGSSVFPGGTITGGTLSGTGFGNSTIGDNSTYAFEGQGAVSIGTTVANGSNFLTFQSNTIKGIPSVPFSVDGHHLSGAVRAQLTRNNDLIFGGYKAGQASFSGPLIGGELPGTIYSVSGNHITSTANVLLAFGKDPLNKIPSSPVITSNTVNGYIIFKNGKVGQISSGEIVFPFVSPGVYGGFPGGAVLGLGSDVLNAKGPYSALLPILSFLHFK